MRTIGITGFTCPVRIPEKGGSLQQTVASIDLVAEQEQATEAAIAHTEVLARLLNAQLPDIHSGIFPALLRQVCQQAGARQAWLEMRFPYFIEKHAPISGTASLMEYQCSFLAWSEESGEPMLRVLVPVTTVCPCSKEISDAGAHNQRAEINLLVKPRGLIWLEDLIALAESCGSSEVYALLKRPDEKHLTETAYKQPMFVEDVARMVAQKAAQHPLIEWFSVEVESFESIHNHSAYALVDSDGLEEAVVQLVTDSDRPSTGI